MTFKHVISISITSNVNETAECERKKSGCYEAELFIIVETIETSGY